MSKLHSLAPSDSLASVPHRTASAAARSGGACWEYEVRHGIHAPRPLIIARVILGARPFDIEIPVCTSRKPRRLAWSMRFLGGNAWRVSCARYGYQLEFEIAQPTSFLVGEDGEGMPIGSIDLVAAPPDRVEEMLAIDEV